MTASLPGHRLVAATAIHRGDREYQQDQVRILAHPRVAGCVLGIVADGMGGKSGGRKASDQVVLTAQQLFERFVPATDDPAVSLRQLVIEAHQMIKLTAITAEAEPHSTVAAFLITPELGCHVIHAGDSRVYHFRRDRLQFRTSDHSFVQRLVDEGQLTPQQALTHPQSNLLTGCLGTQREPPVTQRRLTLLPGDAVMACSDGVWHYFGDDEMAQIVDALPPREAGERLVAKARERARRGNGDNLSLALVRVQPL